MSVVLVLVVVAFGTAVASLAGRCPVTLPVFVLSLIELIRVYPLR